MNVGGTHGRRRARFGLAVAVVASSAPLLVAGTAAADDLPAPTRSGDVVIVDASNPVAPVDEGGSSTPYTLELPGGASCPGDSANDDYRFQSYLVPEGKDPAAIEYTSIGPAAENETALYQANTDALAHAFTLPNDVPGKPGILPPMPPLTFSSYIPGFVAPGTYRLGIACTYLGTTTNYWDTTISVASDPADQPANVHWTALATPPPSTGGASGSSSLVAAGAVVLLVLVAGGAVVWRRRRTHVSPR